MKTKTPVAKRVDKIMVFKPYSELPPAFKYIDLKPDELSKVVVLEQTNTSEEIYLTVRFKGNKKAIFNRRHFFTLGQSLVWLKRQGKNKQHEA